MKTDKELRQLARRIVQGEVFMANNPEIIQLSFMVLSLVDPKDLPDDIGSVYEEMSKAGPRSVNGYPCFFSCQILSVAETKLTINYIKEFEELMKTWDK